MSQFHSRDKAFIALLWETGARIGELIDLTIGDIEDHKHGKKVVIAGKTGARRLPLISSVPHLQSWLNSHPRSGEKDAPLWVNIGTRNTGKKVEYRTMKKALDETMKRTDIDKPVNPHHFRHSRATYLASKFTEAQMCEWFGWVQGSKQPAKYVHLSGRDIDADYAKLHRVEEEEEIDRSKLAPVECPRCGESNDPQAKFCHRCGLVLDEETAMEMDSAEEETIAEFSKLAKNDKDLMEMLGTISKMYELAKKDPEIREKLKGLK